MITVLTLFGTRPEVIKLAPVIRQLELRPEAIRTVNVTSGQHADLLRPFIELFEIRVDRDLKVMAAGQTPSDVCARVLPAVDALLVEQEPDLVLVQGDTTTAMAGALAAFHRRIPVGHVEAGLRSGDPASPFPEEMNRRLLSRLATYHFAATPRNRETLVREGIGEEKIFVTGNPVVDTLQEILRRPQISGSTAAFLGGRGRLRLVVVTTHRRESFGLVIRQNLEVLRRFVETHEEAGLVFPVHPNPNVAETVRAVFERHPRVFLLEPLPYPDFVMLMSRAWLIVSDSGGVQEEAPTLGRPLLIMRGNTERPEAVESGVARLVGGSARRLAAMLEEAWQPGSWADRVGRVENPFGRGDAGQQIVEAIVKLFPGRS